MGRSRQPRRLLEGMEDILGHRLHSPSRRDAFLGLLVSSVRELPGDIKTRGSLACSDHR